QVVTAELTIGSTQRELRDARATLESALVAIERRQRPTPRGLGAVVAWGTPYFRRYVPRVHGRGYPDYLPVDRRASRAERRSVPAFFDIDRFPSDPSGVRLERNDLAVVLQSDVLAHINDESTYLFKQLSGMVRITSVRRG